MIIASIDLMNGKIVQLRQGRRKQLQLEEEPLRFAEALSSLPAIQVIDLDAAMGNGSNSKIVKEICSTVNARVGGGIRSTKKAGQVLGWGAKKIIIGSKASPLFVQSLEKEFGRDCLHRGN